MKISLTDGYYITADAYNFILMKEYVVKKGKFAGSKKVKRVGYWSNKISGLNGCIKRYLEISSLEGEKLAESNFDVFCDHLSESIDAKSAWIVQHIAELVSLDDEIEKVRECCGDD